MILPSGERAPPALECGLNRWGALSRIKAEQKRTQMAQKRKITAKMRIPGNPQMAVGYAQEVRARSWVAPAPVSGLRFIALCSALCALPPQTRLLARNRI